MYICILDGANDSTEQMHTGDQGMEFFNSTNRNQMFNILSIIVVYQITFHLTGVERRKPGQLSFYCIILQSPTIKKFIQFFYQYFL